MNSPTATSPAAEAMATGLREPEPDECSARAASGGESGAASSPQSAAGAATNSDGRGARRHAGERSPAKAAPKKHVILFLAANPIGTDRLALDREARSIRAELKRSGYRDRFEFETRWAAEPLDLLRELRELKPTVVHFSGHGRTGVTGAPGSAGGRDVVDASAPAGDEPQGLVFQDATGSPQVVSPEAIAHAFGAAGASVKLVVLNACFTEPIAEALLANVDCVVGMSGSIHDDAARSFAIGFYGGLGEYESVAAAVEHGKAAIRLDGLPDAAQPRLQVRTGFDATEFILAAVAPSMLVATPCPYPGMRPFAADDAGRFHGREAEITELIGRLRAGQREIFVVGPSGSGKSSLVAAGVLPRIARGFSGLGPFVVRELRPGDQPFSKLCQALAAPPGQPLVATERVATLLAHRAPGASALIVVDQLEELFTQAGAEERAAFLDSLRALRSEPRCAVIYTLRADFSGALMESPLWPERPAQLSRVDVIPLRSEALREAITAPAEEVGVTVEPELTERLVVDAASEPGILPLLQEAMVQLWDARANQTLALADYQALGDGVRSGLAVALAHRADATLQRFNAAQTDIARRILLRLISFGEGRSDTRRQQPRAQLCAAGEDAAEFARVLQTMVDDRLLTVDDDVAGEPRVDLAHEVMISAWPTLAGWIRAHRVDEQRRRQLEDAAARWVEHGRGARGLLDPLELADAELWQQTESAVRLGQSTAVRGLIAASKAAQIQQRRRRRVIVGAMSLLGVVAVAVAAAALAARDLANRNRELVALSYEEAGRQFLIDQRFQEAIPYLLAARRGGKDSAPLRMMFWEAQRHLPLIPALEHQAPVVSVAFSVDGTRIVTASRDHTARVWDATTGKPITGPLAHQEQVLNAAFSSDGARIVTASRDHTARVWDAATGTPILAPLEHHGGVVSAAFSPDGSRVVTASEDKTARVWDAATGRPLTGPLEHQGRVVSAAFSPDGSRVVTASWDQTARVWDAATGKPLAGPLSHQAPLESAAFSPDGTRVITASDTVRVWDATTGTPLFSPLEHQDGTAKAFSRDGTRVVIVSDGYIARVWDVTTGTPLSAPLKHQDQVASASFSPDGSRVVTTSWDKTARVWDAATGKPLSSPLEHQAHVESAVFSPDGSRVVTASEDHTARMWDTATGKPLFRPFVHPALVVMSAAFSRDGSRVVTAGMDGTAGVWDVATGKAIFHRFVHPAPLWGAAFSPDGTRIVTASNDHTARVWDVATGQPLPSRFEHQDQVVSAAFSPDGTRVVTASLDGTARVWDVATGKPLTRPLVHQGKVWSGAFSPDGTRVVTASLDRTARVWNAASGELLGPLEHQGPVVSAAFSPNGSRIVTASRDHTARVWDAVTGKPLASPLEHQGPVVSAVFSPDGSRVVTASEDHTARVWDVTTGKPLTSPLEHPGPVASAAFSPDGTCIVTAGRDMTARVWDAVTGKPVSSPLAHMASVSSAAFSPDGTSIITANYDNAALVWDVRQDIGTLDQWSAVAERSPFLLSDRGVLVRRSPPRVHTQAR